MCSEVTATEQSSLSAEGEKEAHMMVSPRIGVVPEHVILGGSEVAANSEHDHEADVGQNRQLPSLPARTALRVLEHLECALMDGGN